MRRLAPLFGVCALSSGAVGLFAACGTDEVVIPPAAIAVDGSPPPTSDSGGGGDASVGGDGGGDGAVVVDSGKPCPPPTDPTKAALCIDLIPEKIQFEAAPDLDGRGYLAAYAYDSPQPDNDAGGATPLGAVTIPASEGGAEADLRAPPELRFDGLDKNRVFVRVAFVDGRIQREPEAGWWFGGVDLSKGLRENIPIQGIDVKKGEGTRVAMTLTALRRLQVTVARSVLPVGNGQGPLAVTALSQQNIAAGNDVFGVSSTECANLSAPGTSAKTTGFVVGKGAYFLLPVLDDFGAGGFIPQGSLTALDQSGATPKIPAANKVTYASDAYVVTAGVTLTTSVPRVGGPPDGVTCP
ncbi:MAG: hypothetical protein JNL38_02350 [Myxococcales bacterium]|jgi:hypothetical protein|nr:hypothetical protein [Myxococcales bacterium]